MGKTPEHLSALLPREGNGHQFVFYGDCCSGVPGAPYEANFEAVNRVVARLDPRPDFICFLGDHVRGMTDDYEELRRQWRYWHEHEMAWLDWGAVPVYHTTSNHNTYDAGSEEVWRSVFPDIPRNGPPDQLGLSYFVRRGDLLLVAANTSFSGLGGYGHVESEWLDAVLSSNHDAAHKVVLGHHPVFPVNGYDETPLWCIEPGQGRAFWEVLVRHGVLAYLCSHIIAFDAQVHEGVLQVTTGGAGTGYGPNGFMPGPVEYHHAVQGAIDARGFRYQVLDTDGRVREWLDWPIRQPAMKDWTSAGQDGLTWRTDRSEGAAEDHPVQIFFLEADGVVPSSSPGQPHPMLRGFLGPSPHASVSISVEGESPQITARLEVEPGDFEVWRGPTLVPGEALNLQLAFHAGMGPGGVLLRERGTDAWTSMESSSARGLEMMKWPTRWEPTLG